MNLGILRKTAALAVSGALIAGTASILPFETTAAPNAASGDVNGDGKFNTADAEALQNWLLGKTTTLDDWQAANFVDDDRLDVYDLIAMKQKLAHSTTTSPEGYDGLVINEVCTTNKESLKDSAGKSPDWIELYNSGNSTIDLSGVGLSDGSKNRYKFTFPNGTVIKSGEYIVVYCDSIATGKYVAPFSLKSAGETVYLTAPMICETENGADIDIVEVPELPTDVTYGRFANGSGTFDFLKPSPSAENSARYGLVKKPEFSAEGGFYDSGFDLTLTAPKSYQIIYTLDGSDPRTSSTAKTYTGGIKIYDNTDEPNVWSAVKEISLVGYDPPNYNVDKGIVVRAVCKNDDGEYSDVATNNYYVNKTASYYKDMKVLSISTDPDNFFSNSKGIYMIGDRYNQQGGGGWFMPLDPMDKNNPTNYNGDGREWERPCNIQVFEDGKLKFTEDVGVRIAGGWTTANAQKSMTFFARSDYGASKMHYDFFEGNARDVDGNKIKEYKKVTIRNGGNDDLTKFRDDLNQSLAEGLNVGKQAKYDYIVFLDGEFWGYYSMQEKLDDNYIESHYHVDSDNVTTLKVGKLDDGSDAGYRAFREFWQWARSADMSKPENYQKVCENFDIDSYTDYIAFQSYIANWDCLWNTNNWMIWRSNTVDPENPYADGKWRFLLYDTEYSTGLQNTCGAKVDYFSHIDNSWQESSIGSLWRSLLKNSEFKDKFYKRFVEIANDTFDYTKVNARIDEFDSRLGTAIKDTFKRFGNDTNYDSNLVVLRNFFEKRGKYAIHHLNQLYGINDEFVADENMVDASAFTVWMNNGSGYVEYGANDSLKVVVTKSGQYAQLSSESLNLKAGKTYTMTYTISASKDMDTFVMFQRAEGDYRSYYEERFHISTSPQQRTEVLNMTNNDNNVKFLVNLEGCEGTINISNIKLTESK